MVKDIKDQFIETIPVERQAFFWVGLYYYLTKAAVACPNGEQVIRKAVRAYGAERSVRRRNIVLAKGWPINLVSLFTNGDLNGDERFEQDDSQCVLTEELRRHIVTRCPDAEMWSQLGDDETKLGRIYCEEVHHTLYGCFDDAVQVNLCETITHGDPVCRFCIYCNKSNQKPREDAPYVPEVWEDTGKDGIKCNFTMFALLYYHLAKEIAERLGQDILEIGIKAFAEQRGKRLKELDRRSNRASTVDSLLKNGDLFLDPRFDVKMEKINAGYKVAVKRCVFAEVQACHGAADLGRVYCAILYKELLEAYNPKLKVAVEHSLCAGSKECQLLFTEGA